MKMTNILVCFFLVITGLNLALTPIVEAATFLNITLINQNPDPARAGETVELRFMIENPESTEAKNVQIELLPAFPFKKVPGEGYVREISTISAYQTGTNAIIMKFKVMVDKDAVRGTNEIEMKQTFIDIGFSTTYTYDVAVTGAEFAQIIFVDKAKLDPGAETDLKFTITNVGNSPLSNLIFSWSEKNGVILPVYSDDTKYIKNIDVGESVDLEYIVVADINADSGLYQLDLSLKYETDEGTTQQLDTKAGIFIGGETDFDVTFSESSEGQTSLSVANTGNNPALSVTVRIPEQEGFRVSGSTSSIIGNLDKGDYTIVSFQITETAETGIFNREQMSQMTTEERQRMFEQMSQRNATQGKNLKVKIEYTDTTGVRHTLEKMVPIQFRDIESTSTVTTRFGRQTDSWAGIMPYIYLLILIISVVVLYKKRKRVKKLLKRKGG